VLFPQPLQNREDLTGIVSGDETLGHALHHPLGEAGDNPGRHATAAVRSENAVERLG
jgi:hypothetical protein